MRTRNKTIKINQSLFTKVTTPEAAYILGFLWADGFLGSHYTINTEIVSEDAIIIEKIFLSTGKWYIYTRTRNNYKPQTKFSCTNKTLYEYLIKLGFNSKNKSPNKILKTIPKKLQHYWFNNGLVIVTIKFKCLTKNLKQLIGMTL